MKNKLKNLRIRVNSPEESKLLQEYLFSVGFFWRFNDREIQAVHSKFISTTNDFRLLHGNNTDKDSFPGYTHIHAKDILRINWKEEVEK